MLVLVVGPSGAGKDTLLDLARAALAGEARVRVVRREITRPAGAGGENHIAITPTEFARRRDQYALSWEAHGLGYGIPGDIADDLADDLNDGRTDGLAGGLAGGRVVVANVSRAVIAEAAARFAVTVLEITAPPFVLAARLAARGRETADDIAARMARQISLPAGVPVVTVINDRTPAEGAALVQAAILGVIRTAR